MEILTIYGWILAWFAILTAILIGWQLYNAINITTIIKEKASAIAKAEIDVLRQELQESIKTSTGKNMAVIHYNFAQTLAFEGELKLAFIPYVIAFVEFNTYDKGHAERANCLKSINDIIKILETDKSFSIPNKAAADLIAGLNGSDVRETGDVINFIIAKCCRNL